MPSFGSASKTRLATAHPELQRLFNEVIKTFDCTILEGHRGEAAQTEAVRTGHSKTPWPKSKHNKYPSLAVDVAPYPVKWNDLKRFYFFAGYVKGIASKLGIAIRWGGDWDSDTEVGDETFVDLPHFELADQ